MSRLHAVRAGIDHRRRQRHRRLSRRWRPPGGAVPAVRVRHHLWRGYRRLRHLQPAAGRHRHRQSFGALLKGSKLNKASYVELLSLLYATFKLAKTKGDLALESHVDNPDESALFQAYPGFAKNHEAVEFFCDNLRLLTLGSCNPHELEAVMDAELEAQRTHAHAVGGALQTVADGMPALGIVAAVLAVIHTMGAHRAAGNSGQADRRRARRHFHRRARRLRHR